MTYRILFLLGLALEVFGQVLLAQGNDFVYALRPIDFAHWSLLVGAVLMLPQVVTFPKKIFSLIGTPTAMIGIVCIIGMCVLDFIWWSMPDQEMRNEFASHISQVPSIWTPFITDGPRFLTVGLSILSLNYFKDHKLGVALVIISTLILIHVIPVPFRLISGYSLTMIGFAVIFFKEKFD